MPQMAPYNWTILFLIFSLILIIIISINYYINQVPSTLTAPKMSQLTKFNFMW